MITKDFFLSEPWSHQLEGVNRAFNLGSFGYFFDMGTGKTFTTINTLRAIFNDNKRYLKTLVLCPVIVKDNWRKELTQFSHIPNDKIQVLEGSGKKRIKQLESNRPIVITNIETLSMADLWSALTKYGFEVVVIDEAHRLKNPTGKRTKAMIKLTDSIRHKFILTGSPILNSYIDIWSQLRFIKRGLLPDNFYSFRMEYFYDVNANNPRIKFPNFQPRKDKLPQLKRIINSVSMTVKKEEVLDLPDLIEIDIELDLLPAQKKLYKEMEKDFITFLDDEACVAELALTKGLRLLQLCSGVFTTDKVDERGKPIVMEIATPKEAALIDLLTDLGKDDKAIVWSHFAANYDRLAKICEKLKLPYGFITGRQNEKQKQETIDKLYNNEIKVVIANQAAAGTGVNLTPANINIYYSKGYGLEHDTQSKARSHRGGQTKKVTIYNLLIEDTIEELVYNALKHKLKMADAILDYKKVLT